ncbi:MAG: DNA (cytosine-5-)-methyltransferase, partial [Verrucomicrobiota bacterium]
KKSLGRKHGFLDPTQGTLFFDIKRILHAKRPAAFFLENVKHLMHHDGGKTFKIIRKTLEEDLGYTVSWQVVDAARWVPQSRKRIFIVGYNPDKVRISKEKIIIPTKPAETYRYPELNRIIQRYADDRYILGPGTWATLERHKKHHAEAGNGFGYGLIEQPIPAGMVTRTISARYHKDGAEILVSTEGPRPRKLTIEEAAQLQGFDPTRFVFPVSDTQAYRQIGNSVAVPAVEAAAREIAKVLKDE